MIIIDETVFQAHFDINMTCFSLESSVDETNNIFDPFAADLDGS